MESRLQNRTSTNSVVVGNFFIAAWAFLGPAALPAPASLLLDNPTFYNFGGAPRSIVVGNYEANTASTADTDPDIYVGDYLSPGLAVRANSAGTFGAATTIESAGALQNMIYLADVDGDGSGMPNPDAYIDLVQVTPSVVNWYRRDPATGTLSAMGALSVASNDADYGGTPANIAHVEFADINQDGHLDFVLMTNVEISWYARQPDATYVRTVLYRSFAIETMHLADINGDTYPDLLSNQGGTLGITYYDPDPSVENFEGNFIFYEEDEVTIDRIVSTWYPLMRIGLDSWVDTVDLDGDGDLELFTPENIMWYNGTFAETSDKAAAFSFTGTSLLSVRTKSIQLTDADGDGDEDLLALLRGQLYTATRTGPTTFSTPAAAPLTPYTSVTYPGGNDFRIHLADIDGDGGDELILPPVRVNASSNGALVYKVNVALPAEINLGDSAPYNPVFEEDDGAQNVIVSLSEMVPFEVQIRLQTFADTATEGADYVGVDTVVIIPADTLSVNVPITIQSDDEYDPLEEFRVVLSEPTPDDGSVVLGSRIDVSAVITDNDTISIESDASILWFDEGIGTLLIEFRAVTPLSTFPPISVSYNTEDVDITPNELATAGVDYTPVSDTLTFTPENRTQTIAIPITDDPTEENPWEYFLLSVRPQGQPLNIEHQSTILELLDNEFPTFAETIGTEGVPSGVDGPLEDASGDGIPNLLLYALGLGIQSPDPAEVTRHRLSAGASEIEGTGSVAFILPRPAPGDVRYIVEEFCDGGPWTVIATKEGRGRWTGTATVSESNSMAGEVTYTVSGTSGATVCFYRVRFELIP